MKWIVNDAYGFATSLKSFAGSNLTLTNSSATDVYYDVTAVAAQLNASLPGTIPTGTKIGNGGGTVNFQVAPKELWIRAATQTVLDVQADAPAANIQTQTVLAGDNTGNQNVVPPRRIQIGASMRRKDGPKYDNL